MDMGALGLLDVCGGAVLGAPGLHLVSEWLPFTRWDSGAVGKNCLVQDGTESALAGGGGGALRRGTCLEAGRSPLTGGLERGGGGGGGWPGLRMGKGFLLLTSMLMSLLRRFISSEICFTVPRFPVLAHWQSPKDAVGLKQKEIKLYKNSRSWIFNQINSIPVVFVHCSMNSSLTRSEENGRNLEYISVSALFSMFTIFRQSACGVNCKGR